MGREGDSDRSLPGCSCQERNELTHVFVGCCFYPDGVLVVVGNKKTSHGFTGNVIGAYRKNCGGGKV